MELTIMIGPGQVKAIARVLEADAMGTGYSEEDGRIRDRLLAMIVGKSAVIYGLRTRAIERVVARDYREFVRGRKAVADLNRSKQREQRGKGRRPRKGIA